MFFLYDNYGNLYTIFLNFETSCNNSNKRYTKYLIGFIFEKDGQGNVFNKIAYDSKKVC